MILEKSVRLVGFVSRGSRSTTIMRRKCTLFSLLRAVAECALIASRKDVLALMDVASSPAISILDTILIRNQCKCSFGYKDGNFCVADRLSSLYVIIVDEWQRFPKRLSVTHLMRSTITKLISQKEHPRRRRVYSPELVSS
jgi:hypothetical protein